VRETVIVIGVIRRFVPTRRAAARNVATVREKFADLGSMVIRIERLRVAQVLLVPPAVSDQPRGL